MEKFAQVILKAQEIREESFDDEAANKAEKSEEKWIDFNKFYKLSIEGSVNKACEELDYDKRAAQIIYLINKNIWNDAQDWASSIILLKKINR